jgi:hypothetical protein
MYDGKLLFSGHQINFNSRNSLFTRALCYAWSEGDTRPTPLSFDKKFIEGTLKEDMVKKLELKQLN